MKTIISTALINKWVAVLTLTLLLSSCSTKLVYNYADWYIFWKVGDYVELSDSQQTALETKVELFIEWHRTHELPYYLTLLEKLKNAVDTKDEAALTSLYFQTQLIWQRSAQYLAPVLIDLLHLLTHQQKQALITNIANIQQEQHQQWLDESSDFDAKLEKQISRFEQYFGDLTKNQKMQLESIEKKLPNTLEHRINGRKRWLAQFTKALMLDLPTEENKKEMDVKLLTQLFTNMNSYRTPQYIELKRQATEFHLSKLKTLLNSLSDKQTETLLQNADDLSQDIQELISEK